MKRRSFLKAVAVAAPAAGFHDFLVARAQAPAPFSSPIARGPRRRRPFRPSPLPRVQLHSFQSAYQRNRRRPVRHGAHAPPARWAAPAPAPESGGMVLRDGRRSGLPGGRAKGPLHAGDSVLAPRRVPHTFSSVGPAPARMIVAFSPAGKMEQYFRDAETARQHAGDADFMARYEMERVGPSPFWKA